jgi:hypothetical protein
MAEALRRAGLTGSSGNSAADGDKPGRSGRR